MIDRSTFLFSFFKKVLFVALVFSCDCTMLRSNGGMQASPVAKVAATGKHFGESQARTDRLAYSSKQSKNA